MRKNEPKPKVRGGQQVVRDGKPVYRVRIWDPVLRKQIEECIPGEGEAWIRLHELEAVKRRKPGSLRARQKITFSQVCDEFLLSFATRLDGSPRPLATWRGAQSYIDCYLRPTLGEAYIDDLDVAELKSCLVNLKRRDGKPASGATKSSGACNIRRVFAYAREKRYITTNAALELPNGWGGVSRRRTLIPSLPQVDRLAAALDEVHPGDGDIVRVLALVGLRIEELAYVPLDLVDLVEQSIPIVGTASESGGKRDVREETKTSAGNRTVSIPDQAMPAVRRLVERARAGAARRPGRFTRLVNGDRGGFMCYSVWRRRLAKAHALTAAHPDGKITYTAHDLRHVCAALLIASGLTDVQIAYQMGHASVVTTKTIYAHLFNQDRRLIGKAMSETISRLYAADEAEDAQAA